LIPGLNVNFPARLYAKKVSHHIRIAGLKFHNFSSFVLIFTMILTLVSCEEFVSSQTDSHLQKTEIIIAGTVRDIFSQAAVYGATIQLGEDYQVYSDVKGQFLIQYLLTTDDERNKPLSLQISAPNYFPFDQELVIYPMDYDLEISLVYAAPIIQESVLVLHQFIEFRELLYVCQLLLTDYQGYSDVDSVKAIFYYLNNQTQEVRRLISPMVYIAAVSQNTAYFEATAFPDISDIWELQKYYDISAVDKSGYSTYVQDMIPAMTGDTLIFPPVFVQPYYNFSIAVQ
jgi:hypothetical protein